MSLIFKDSVIAVVVHILIVGIFLLLIIFPETQNSSNHSGWINMDGVGKAVTLYLGIIFLIASIPTIPFLVFLFRKLEVGKKRLSIVLSYPLGVALIFAYAWLFNR